MTLTLDATVGGSAANSYCDLTTAQGYLDGRPFAAAWTAASATQQTQALVYATTLLDREKWVGTKGMTIVGGYTQALAWPRRWAPSLEFDQQEDYIAEYFVDLTVAYYSSLQIPAPIIRATCELALAILNAGTSDPFIDGTRNIKSERVDVLDTVYLDIHLRTRGLGLFPQVVALVAPLLRSQQSGAQVERV
jgi:hypothetical protein